VEVSVNGHKITLIVSTKQLLLQQNFFLLPFIMFVFGSLKGNKLKEILLKQQLFSAYNCFPVVFVSSSWNPL